MSDSFISIPPPTADLAVAVLMSAAEPQDWARIIAARPEIVRIVLDGNTPIPTEFAEVALRRGEGLLLVSLLKGHERVVGMPDVLDRLAATGHPELFHHGDGDFKTRLLASAHLGPSGWDALDLARWVDWMRPADELRGRRRYVHSRLPKLLTSTLRHVGHLLSEREQALALWNLRAAAGPAAAEAWFKDLGELGERAAAEVSAGGDLSGLTAWADGPEATLRELRGGRSDLAWLVERRTSLDWPALREAHAAEPFGDEAAGVLAARADCPAEFAIELYVTSPAVVAERAARIGRAFWAAKPVGSAAVIGRATKTLIGRFVAEGRPDGLFAEARPAVAVLEALRVTREKHPEAAAVLMAELSGPVSGFGADPAAWRALRAALKSAKGLSVEELFDKARTIAGSGKAPARWPDEADVPSDGKPSSLSGARSAFVPLFDAAAAETRLALLPHVDGRTRHDVFTQGSWRAEWLDEAVARGERSWCLSLASRASLGTEEIQRLLERDDPEINARLFTRSRISNRQRTAILSGRRFGDGEGPVPLDPGLRKRLLERDGGWRGTDVIDCADAELQTHILSSVRVRGDMPQTRLLLDAWERHGVELAVKYVKGDVGGRSYSPNPISPAVKRRFEKLFALDDPSGELAGLRAETEESLTAAWQIAEVRRERSDHFDLAKHSHHWHWPELLDAHRAEPFSPWMVKGFDASTAGCPEEFARESAALGALPEYGESWSDATLGAAEVRQRLAAPLPLDYRERRWLRMAVARGVIDIGEVVATAHPTAIALAGLPGESGEAVAKLLAGSVNGDADAWMVVLGMIRDFQGTLPELLATAKAAVG
ncbi:hypothetical protein [Phytomonospora endophytica]|uniref:Uncharacterized protein n=1 Tax=Phytomonospora endophytica TaxID=714109 RepID=A0A841F8D9_9ACTN|nr:hypothetical protein [Phytomonospora endophytica]MBB6032486.1 hypothetical protein [Phytomonospora endophytica]GIG66365.1 hypothetical protein Pen01_26600 [Phytomonospora endophytica]